MPTPVRTRPSSGELDTPAGGVSDAGRRRDTKLAVMSFLAHQNRRKKSIGCHFLNVLAVIFAPVVALTAVPRKSLSQSHHRFSTNAADT